MFCAESSVVVFLSLLCFRLVILLFYVFIVYLYSCAALCAYSINEWIYAADIWTSLSADVRTLNAFHQKRLKQLLGIQWYDRVRNDELLQRTGLTSLPHLLSRRRILVFGLAWGKGKNVTLHDSIWHVSSRSGEGCCKLLYSVYLYRYLTVVGWT